jgi:large subunit ribosomal protein L17
MRHLNAGRKLGRNAPHRLALMRNLARALFEHGRIITTVEKAKEARRFVEKLITLAKRGTQDGQNALHARRLVLARLPDREAVSKLFNEIAPRYTDRPGGYTRVIKRHERRLGDAGQTAFLELLKEGETKVRTRERAPAPAPRVREPEPQRRELETPALPSAEATQPPASEASTSPAPSEGEAPAQTPPPENPPAP